MPAARKASTQPRSRGTAKRLASPSKPVGHAAAKVSPIGDVEVPALPPHQSGGEYLSTSVAAWHALWAEPQSTHLSGSQMVVPYRWIWAFEALQRALAAVSEAPLVNGSKGQPVGHPLMSWVASREVQMEKCERQLGIGLRNKADLGLTTAQARLTAQQLNEMHQPGGLSIGTEQAAIESAGEEDGWSAG